VRLAWKRPAHYCFPARIPMEDRGPPLRNDAAHTGNRANRDECGAATLNTAVALAYVCSNL